MRKTDTVEASGTPEELRVRQINFLRRKGKSAELDALFAADVSMVARWEILDLLEAQTRDDTFEVTPQHMGAGHGSPVFGYGLLSGLRDEDLYDEDRSAEDAAA